MQAAIYHSFGESIKIETIRIPETPDDGVLIQVMASGVCRSDWHGWRGHDADIHRHGLPFCPGHELSGVVVQVGKLCKKFHVGDRVAVPFILACGECVYCRHENRPTVCLDQRQPGFTQFGSFAEYVAIPRADRNLSLLPSNVSFLQAAALGCRFTTAYRAVVQQGRLEVHQSLAVFGAGGVGLSCVMIAAAVGCKQIIAVDVSQEALRKAMEVGATHTVLVQAGNDDNNHIQEQVLKLTSDHQGCHVSIDAAGFRSTCENAIYCTRRGGRMIQVGLPIGQDKPQVPMGLVAAREIELVGSHGFAAADLPDLLDLVATNKLDPAVLVERQVDLEEGARVLMEMDRHSPLGMTVITKFNRNTSRL